MCMRQVLYGGPRIDYPGGLAVDVGDDETRGGRQLPFTLDKPTVGRDTRHRTHTNTTREKNTHTYRTRKKPASRNPTITPTINPTSTPTTPSFRQHEKPASLPYLKLCRPNVVLVLLSCSCYLFHGGQVTADGVIFNPNRIYHVISTPAA